MTGEAEKKLVIFGSMHIKTLITLALTILAIGIVSFVIFSFFNNKKPPQERKSKFALFIYSLLVSFFATVLFFVYRFVIIGLEILTKGN